MYGLLDRYNGPPEPQALDHERGVQVQRFDAEMQRYEERARQRDSNLAEVRNAVTKEMMDVQRVARDYVRQVWEERSEAELSPWPWGTGV